MVKSTKSKVLRVLLVDEHPMVRVPLAALINAEPDFTVCGQACNRTEALSVARAKAPDLAVVGLKLRDSHGLDLIKDLHSQRPDVAVIVLSTFDGDNWAERSLRAGARGFVSKNQQPAELLTAMRQVLAGEFYVNGSQSGTWPRLGPAQAVRPPPWTICRTGNIRCFGILGMATRSGRLPNTCAFRCQRLRPIAAGLKTNSVVTTTRIC